MPVFCPIDNKHILEYRDTLIHTLIESGNTNQEFIYQKKKAMKSKSKSTLPCSAKKNFTYQRDYYIYHMC